MCKNNKLYNLIKQVEIILFDIEKRENLDTIGDRYSDLKSEIENKIKLYNKSIISASSEDAYFSAIKKFHSILEIKKVDSNYAKIYDALLEGVGTLKWHIKHY